LNPRQAFRFLWTGAILIAVTCIVGVVAINTSTGLLYLLLGLLMGFWVVSAIFSTINLMGITVTRHVSETSQVGEKLLLTYTVKNNKRFLRSYSLVIEELGHFPMIFPSAYCMSLRAGQERIIKVEVLCRRRGHMRLRRIRLSSRFPLGLIAKCFVSNEAADVVVHPAVGHLRYHLLAKTKSSASGSLGQYNQQTKGFEEFYGLREFQNFDNYHWIHWRSSAKYNRLMVKEMSEYNSNQITIMLDTRVEDPLSVEQQDMLEEAISFAATMIDRATERCLPVALAVSGGEVKMFKRGRGAAHRWALMTELAGVRMGTWEDQLPGIDTLHPRTFADAHCWVIGVGIYKHGYETGRFRPNVTLVDVDTEAFHRMFSPPELLSLSRRKEGKP